MEHIIRRESQANGTAINDLDGFLSNGADGVFIADKSVIKKSSRIQFPGAEPDYLIFVKDAARRECVVLELKDGDQFDTKKSAGEIGSLTAFSTNVGSTLPYATTIKVCSFNQEDKPTIVAGFKQAIDEDMAWTGREFCTLMGFDYDAIVSERVRDADANRRFLVEQMLSISPLRQIAIRMLAPEAE